jgi:hypothetical protein
MLAETLAILEENSENFLEHIETVLEHLVPYEKKIEDINGTEYLLKIAPLELKKK